MTSDGTHSYTWDARNRLKRIDLGNTASFTYDPFGRRATKSTVGTSTTFLYDDANPGLPHPCFFGDQIPVFGKPRSTKEVHACAGFEL